MPDIAVEHPSNPEHGDFATSLPLRLARAVRISPMKIAEELVKFIPAGDEVEQVSVAAPGFINFRLKDRWLGRPSGRHFARAGQDYGIVRDGPGQKVLVEYVSVNPTGPVHVGHTRGAVLGSTLARVLDAAGYAVTSEYYINDAGSQMEAFYGSVYTRYKQALGHEAELPPNGYAGDYIADIAREIVAREGDRFIAMSEEGALVELGRIAREMMVQLIREDLQHIGVEFDSWFSEGSLYQSGEYDKVIDILRREGYVSEREGAQWFTSTALGDDKDNVIIRSTGVPTYFASDIAYHYDKFIRRGYDRAINIWGADHQGHVARMNAAVAALGVAPQRLTTMISQMVTLKRGQEVVRASKRTGESSPCGNWWTRLEPMPAATSSWPARHQLQMEFDLELAKKESSENPVYYVQYGHARIAAILNNARERGIDWSEGDTSLLVQPSEVALIRRMVLLPELVESMARDPGASPPAPLLPGPGRRPSTGSTRTVGSSPTTPPITPSPWHA